MNQKTKDELLEALRYGEENTEILTNERTSSQFIFELNKICAAIAKLEAIEVTE